MANVIVTIREYIIKSPFNANVVADKSTFFRRISGEDKNDIKLIELKVNDVMLRINNSFYLKHGNPYEYILLDLKEDIVINNPRIFELVDVQKKEDVKQS